MKRVTDKLDPVNMVKILIVGRSGVGKTYALGGLRGLWYFTHEADGVPVIRAQNPQAVIFVMEDTLDDYGELKGLLTAKHGKCAGVGCEGCRYTGVQAAADGCMAVGYDSLSTAQQICLDRASSVNNKRRKVPLPDGAFDELDYNLSYHYLARLLSMFRSIPLPVVMLAHAMDPEPEVQVPGGPQVRYVRWYVPGKKFDPIIPRYFTAIGGLHHKIGPPEERVVVFDPTVVWGGRMFRVKSMAGLGKTEPPNPQLWLDNISRRFRGEDRLRAPEHDVEVETSAPPAEPEVESEVVVRSAEVLQKFIPE